MAVNINMGLPYTEVVGIRVVEKSQYRNNSGEMGYVFELVFTDEEGEDHSFISTPSLPVIYANIDPTRSLSFTSPGKVNKTISKDKAKYVVKLNVEDSDADFRSFILKCNETLDKYYEENHLDDREILSWNIQHPKKIGNGSVRPMALNMSCKAYSKLEDGTHQAKRMGVYKIMDEKIIHCSSKKLIGCEVHASCSFRLLLGNHSGFQSTMMNDIILTKQLVRKEVNVTKSSFFKAFAGRTPERKKNNNDGSSSNSSSPNTEPKRKKRKSFSERYNMMDKSKKQKEQHVVNVLDTAIVSTTTTTTKNNKRPTRNAGKK